MNNKTIPNDWIHCFLGDAIIRVVGGGTPSRGVSVYWDGNIPWASVKDFSDDTQRLYDTEEHISSIGLANSAANLIEVGTPIVCTRMAVGRSALAIKAIAINQDLKALYPQNYLNAKYLLVLLNFIRPQLESLSIGSTVKGINVDQLLKIRVSFPALPEQHRIVEILDTIDETIAHTSSLIAKLKYIKAGLLNDLLTRGLDENGELRDAIAHPEQFKNSPLGQIPVDWDVATIDAISIYVGSGITPTGGSNVYKTEGILFIRSQNVTFNGLLLDDVAYIDHKTHQIMKRSEIFEHDVLLNITGASIGRCSPVPEKLGLANVNQHVCAIRLPNSNKEEAVFLSSVLASHIGQSQIYKLNAGGNREGLNYQQIRSFLIPYPSPKERANIAQIIENYDTRIRTEETYLNKLKLQKKGLMHDLLTGKVRVNQVENNVAILTTA